MRNHIGNCMAIKLSNSTKHGILIKLITKIKIYIYAKFKAEKYLNLFADFVDVLGQIFYRIWFMKWSVKKWSVKAGNVDKKCIICLISSHNAVCVVENTDVHGNFEPPSHRFGVSNRLLTADRLRLPISIVKMHCQVIVRANKSAYEAVVVLCYRLCMFLLTLGQFVWLK